MIIADTSGLLALFNRREPAHEATKQVVEESDDVLIISPYVIAELDYLVATRLGQAAELAVLAEISSDAYELATFTATDLTAAASLIERYADQNIGITDASLVVLADRFDTDSILTLDHRHFSVLRSATGTPFRLLPETS